MSDPWDFSGEMPNLSGFDSVQSWTRGDWEAAPTALLLLCLWWFVRARIKCARASDTHPIPSQVFQHCFAENNFQYHEGYWSSYVWLLVIGSFTAFGASWGIGANDVANSFATSVGSKAVTMFQACCIAGVFEFVGAISLGGAVVKTVKSNIADPTMFKEEPQIFAYGMLAASTSVACVLFLATYLKQAVSTTHTVIGAVLGVGLVYGGAEGVTWNEETDEFPFRKGFTPVVISWFVSPVFTAILSSGFFLITRTICLQRQQSYRIAFFFIPVLVTITIFIILLAIFLKAVDSGHDREGEVNWEDDKKAWVAVVTGVGCGIVSIPYAIWLKKSMAKEDVEMEEEQQAKDAEAAHVAAGGQAKEKYDEDKWTKKTGRVQEWLEKAKESKFAQNAWVKDFLEAMTYDVHAHVATMNDPKVAKMHAEAEIFDPRTEDVFKRMQVMTACGVAFVHGANDVANGVGPFAGIWDTYNTYQSGSGKATQPRWILVIGAAGIVFGLAMYGYRIIATLGVDLVVMTPSRGYSVELAATAIIALASTYGLPVSTTQVVTGGEIGVGMCESWRMTGVNWLLFIRTFFGWIGALVCGAILSAFLFSLGVYGPSRTDMDYVLHYQHAMNGEASIELNALIDFCGENGGSGNGCDMENPATDPFCQCNAQGVQYTSADLIGLKTQLDGLFNFDDNGQINQYNMIYLFRQISGLFQLTYGPPGVRDNAPDAP